MTMKLFKQNPLMTVQTCKGKCPNCGKEHSATVCAWSQYYLDGSPTMSLEQYYERFVICDTCGYIFNILTRQPPSDYKKALLPQLHETAKRQYPSVVAKKRALLNVLYPSPRLSWVDLRAAQELGDTALAKQLMEDMLDNPVPFATIMGNNGFLYIRVCEQFFFSPAYTKLDYLRRLERFDEAKAMILKLRERAVKYSDYALQDFLDAQEMLIHEKDTQQH